MCRNKRMRHDVFKENDQENLKYKMWQLLSENWVLFSQLETLQILRILPVIKCDQIVI